jgi:pyruvate,water dikinase
MPDIKTKIMMNVGNPQLAFDFCQLPNGGVGLARLEFIINNNIGVHPKAILDYPNIDADLKKAVESVARGHASRARSTWTRWPKAWPPSPPRSGPSRSSCGCRTSRATNTASSSAAAATSPKKRTPCWASVARRATSAPTLAKPSPWNARPSSRVRNDMGLTNVQVMVPFVRTLGRPRRVTELLAAHGLKRGENGLKVIMMCEVPSNAILADEFLEYFDGFSIGSNDLTQLTLGLDRDSGLELLAADFDERDPAVKALFSRPSRPARRRASTWAFAARAPATTRLCAVAGE